MGGPHVRVEQTHLSCPALLDPFPESLFWTEHNSHSAFAPSQHLNSSRNVSQHRNVDDYLLTYKILVDAKINDYSKQMDRSIWLAPMPNLTEFCRHTHAHTTPDIHPVDHLLCLITLPLLDGHITCARIHSLWTLDQGEVSLHGHLSCDTACFSASSEIDNPSF